MGLTSSKRSDAGPPVLVLRPGEAEVTEEDSLTYLGEPFTKVKPSGPGLPPPGAAVVIKTLNHAAIEAADVDAVADFYINILGFRRIPRPELGFKGHWLEIGGGGAPKFMLHVIAVDPSVPRTVQDWHQLYTRPPEAWYIRRATHLAFEVADFDATEAALRAFGVEYSRHVLPEVGLRQLFMYDPEGHGIEIGVYDDTREFFQGKGVNPPT